MTDQTRGGHEARLGVASDDLVLPKRDAVDVVREWLDIARKEPIRACQVLRYPPICGSEIDAIEVILSRLASQAEEIEHLNETVASASSLIDQHWATIKAQEETIRADREAFADIGGMETCAEESRDDNSPDAALLDDAIMKCRARLAARQEGSGRIPTGGEG